MAGNKVAGASSKRKVRTGGGQKPAGKAKPQEAKPKEAKATEPKPNPVKAPVGAIRDFDKVPDPIVTRVYTSNYDFGSVPQGKALFIPVAGATPEEKMASAKKIRSNIFAALYRFQKNKPETKNWNTAVRIVLDDSGAAKEVGFYREKDKPAKSDSK